MAHIDTPIPQFKLNDGNSIPAIAYGLGTAWFKRAAGDELDQAIVDGVKVAAKVGYTHFDGAEAYNNELELGAAIKQANLPRDKIFVTTKVMKNVDDIPAALKTSLKKLQLDYVDLYLVHSPFYADEGKNTARLQADWAQVEKLKEAGLAKSIGVSNFLIPHLEAILETAKIKPAINQIEWHPYLQRQPLIAFHRQNGIVTEAYGPLTPITKGAPGPVDAVLAALAKKYGVSASEIALRFGIDQDIVVVTTSGKEQRLSDYLRVTTFKLTPAEIEDIQKAGDGKHFRAFFAKNFAADDRS